MEMLALTRTTAWIVVFSVPAFAAAVAEVEKLPQQTPCDTKTGGRHFVDQGTESKYSSDLETILRKWEKVNVSRRRLDAKFSRFKYDRTFEVERCGTGSLAVDVTGRAVYKLIPHKFQSGEFSQRRGKSGQLYELKSENPERWHWTGRSLIKVDGKERTFEEMVPPNESKDGEYLPEPPPLPENSRSPEFPPLVEGESVVENLSPPAIDPASSRSKHLTFCEAIEGYAIGIILSAALSSPGFPKIDLTRLYEVWREMPLARPFLLGIPTYELKKQFHIELLKQTETEVWLKFKSKSKKDHVPFPQVVLILTNGDYKPVAIKTIDETGSEMVHIFSEVRINAADEDSLEDLGRPNLEGYRTVLNEPQKR
jgi:hypothetical protein